MIEYLDGVHEIVNYHSDFKVRVFMNDEYEDYPQHWHLDTEIIMPLYNGYKVKIDEKVYELNEEDILLIPPGELHELFAPEDGKRIILQFDGMLLHEFKGLTSAFHMYHPCVKVSHSEIPELHDMLSGLVNGISDEYFSAKPFREAAAFGNLLQFFTLLGRNHIESNNEFSYVSKCKHYHHIDQMFKVCHYIDKHCTESLEIDYLADLAGFSKYHFHRVFKQVMNVSCYEYLISRRLLEAERLLIEPNLTITEVALKSGFSSLATFNRVFKKKNSCTPSEFKALHRVY